MFVFEVDGVGWLRNSLRQVPDLEVFSLVNRKELTDPSCKASSVISKVLRPFKLFPCPFIFLNFCIIKIKKTPFYLCYCIFGLLVPNCNGRCKIFVEDTIEKLFIMFEKTYLIEPHEYAHSKYPLSDIDIAVGLLRPSVSISIGIWSVILLSILNKPLDVEKKKTYGSVGSNSISMLWVRSSNS